MSTTHFPSALIFLMSNYFKSSLYKGDATNTSFLQWLTHFLNWPSEMGIFSSKCPINSYYGATSKENCMLTFINLYE